MSRKKTVLSKDSRTRMKNRSAIISAAGRVFADLGYEACTIRDIIRESGLSPGTFYNNFRDKESLFLHIVGDSMKRVRLQTGLAKEQAKSGREFIYECLKAFFEVFSDDPLLMKIVARNQIVFRQFAYQTRHLKGMMYDIESALQWAIEKELLPKVPIDLTALALTGSSFEVLESLTHKSKPDIENSCEFLTELFLGGIRKVAVSYRSSDV